MKVNVIRTGKVGYGKSLEMQKLLFDMRLKNQVGDTLILTEHAPVITFGRRGKSENVVAGQKLLNDNGIELYMTNRGGDVTYHGDGQLVGYFVFDIRNHSKGIKEFVWKIEEVIICYLKEIHGIDPVRGEKKYTGIWIGDRKIAAFGIFVSHWITMHGFSFNICPDMSHFKWINPCGITDKTVTSLEMETKKKIDMEEVTDRLLTVFKHVFNVETELKNADELVGSGV